jgi:alpha-tubulin suppressor-like RCC1 family protein
MSCAGSGKTHRTTAAIPLVGALVALAALGGCGSGSTTPTTSTSTTTKTASGPGTVYRWGVVGTSGKIAQLELNSPTPVAGITGTVTQIATSNSDGYALTSNGQVFAWGVNNYGELGNGTTSPYETRAVQVEFPSGVTIATLANPMPFDGALAIDSTHHVWAWGLNGSGDLCLTGLPGHEALRPVELSLGDVTLATGARTHSLFDSGGRVYACGSGDAGELGNGSTNTTTTPTPVVGLPSTVGVTALTSSWEGSGALLENGDYYNWGYNAAGQLGNGTTTNSAVPVMVALPAPVRQVFQGGSGATNGQTVALLSNGSTWAWGANSKGQVGNGTNTNATSPVSVKVPSGVIFDKVNSGGYSSYAIDSSGQLWAWGGNQNGQLGTGNTKRVQTLPLEIGIHLTQVSSTASNVAGFLQQ